MSAPVVACSLFHEFLLGRCQFQIKQTAAVKGMLADHLLTPGMNGMDRGFIHPLRRLIQAPGAIRPPAGFVIPSQGCQIRVPGALSAKKSCSLGQAAADPVPQLLCRGIGKGHHQNFRRGQRTGKGVFSPVSQHQPQIQGRDRVCLAGTCAGLDQANAVQGKGP